MVILGGEKELAVLERESALMICMHLGVFDNKLYREGREQSRKRRYRVSIRVLLDISALEMILVHASVMTSTMLLAIAKFVKSTPLWIALPSSFYF